MGKSGSSAIESHRNEPEHEVTKGLKLLRDGYFPMNVPWPVMTAVMPALTRPAQSLSFFQRAIQEVEHTLLLVLTS